MLVLRLAAPLKDLGSLRLGFLEPCHRVTFQKRRLARRYRIDRAPDQLVPREAEHRAAGGIDVDKRAGCRIAHKEAVADRFEDDAELILVGCSGFLGRASHRAWPRAENRPGRKACAGSSAEDRLRGMRLMLAS